MKNTIGLLFLVLISCTISLGNKNVVNNLNSSQSLDSEKVQDSLFRLDFLEEENDVEIVPPKSIVFSLPDSTAEIRIDKKGDFNADGKEDIMLYLGACGTGGCIYGLFLKQHGNYYKLAFMNYLKNSEFELDKNGFWRIYSTEEVTPYDPTKLYVTIYKFDSFKYHYELDTTYVFQDK